MLNGSAVNGLVQGAMAYSPIGFHIDINPALVPVLTRYVTNQLQLLVANGRSAFVASLGTSPQIYSHNQLVVDAVEYFVTRRLNSTAPRRFARTAFLTANAARTRHMIRG